jgi:glycine cleavage system H lipoate-binding protein
MVALFVIATILLFLGIDLIYQRVQRKKAEAAEPQSVYARSSAIDRISVPEGLFFHPGHTWAAVTDSGLMKVGIDDFTRKLLGRIDGIEFIKTEGEIRQGEPLFVIKQGDRRIGMVAPVDGMIQQTNNHVAGDPQTLRTDTYRNGWLAAIKPSNLKKNLEKLTISESAKEWAREELSRLRDFFAEASFENKLVGQTLQDGGPPVEGVLEYMSDDAVRKFEESFLRN